MHEGIGANVYVGSTETLGLVGSETMDGIRPPRRKMAAKCGITDCAAGGRRSRSVCAPHDPLIREFECEAVHTAYGGEVTNSLVDDRIHEVTLSCRRPVLRALTENQRRRGGLYASVVTARIRSV
jgi:hypothetical protein